MSNEPAPENGSASENGGQGSSCTEHVRDSATLAAGRELFRAMRTDVTVLGERVRRWFAAAQAEKRASKWRQSRDWRGVALGTLQVLAVAAGLAITALSVGFGWALRDVPQLARPIADTDQPSILLEAANGEPLGRVGPFRSPGVSNEDLKTPVVAAIISAEDRRFYSHWGVDPVGIIRALRRNTAAGTSVEGGSTITQQLVKVRLLGQADSLTEKLREALVAMWLDARLTKDEILMHYLDSIYVGQGAYGVSAGARLYFDKSLSEITISEAALLAGLTNCPSHCNPVHNPKRAYEEAKKAIDVMLETGLIDAVTAKKAAAQPVTLRRSAQAARAGSWFADWVSRDVADMTGPFAGRMRVRTTLNPLLQKLAEQVVRRTLDGPGAERGASQAALVAMRPNGAVVAMVGGRDYTESPFNRAVDAKRQPGSAFKLFVYLTALKQGFTLDQTIDASPLTIKGWEPKNFGGEQFGRVSLAEAFSKSINTAAVRLAQTVGLRHVITTARELGIKQPLKPFPSLALGAAEVSLLELTGAFASIRTGNRVKPWAAKSIGDGETRFEPAPPSGPSQSFSPYQEQMVELLQLVVQRGTGRDAALDGFAAGKTGTSQNYRDAWFVGFDESLVVGVWLGNDNGRPTDRVTGGSLPAGAWKEFMTEARKMIDSDERLLSAAPSSDIAADCDYQTCTETYRSFRASDCSYQPYGGGPRQLCDKEGHLEMRPPPEASASYTDSQVFSQRQCSYNACASSYASFDPSDCTYQPYGGGPRRPCEK